jgi:putative phage-type endonuclease
MANNTIIRPANHDEWLEVRRQGIGSSEVATIVGLNPWETPYQLWRKKLGIDAPKAENAAMRNGHILEDSVARWWGAENPAREIIKRSAIDWIARDNDRPYLQVSPDRTFWLGDSRQPDAKGILECKTTRMKVDSNNVPKYWFVQVQYQLGVSGYQQGSLAWLSANNGFDFGFKDLQFVPDFYAWLVEEVARFWTDCILGRKEPDPISAQDVMLKYTRHTEGLSRECSDDTFEAYQELKQVRKELDALDERKAKLEDSLKMAFLDAEALSYGGDLIATWKAPKPSAKFDAKAFQKSYPDIAKEFTTMQQGSRRLLLK